MNSIYIVLSLLFAHIVAAQSGHASGDSHGHSLNKRAAPVPGANGVCYTYTIQRGDTCAILAQRYLITTSNIEAWNTGAWDWAGCGKVKQGDFVCLSSGSLPMPVALPRATCGPQVPGTRRPSNYADLASLNLCSSNQCCSKFGECGTTSSFCEAGKGCISNCGVKSTQKGATSSKTTVSKSTASNLTTSKSTASKSTTSKATTTKVSTKKVASTTTTTKTVSIASSTTTSLNPTETWQVTIYEKGKCTGNYFSAQGHESDKQGMCMVFAENTQTKISDTTTSCRWWTDGGLKWDTCASSKLKRPQSLFLKDGECYFFKGTKCADEDWLGQTYGSFKGCQSDETGNLAPQQEQYMSTNFGDWGSMQCWYTTKWKK
ncbi:uncharacterized protein N7479_009508 [Penicillium vulpinum]|uniref:LysM domain-containing protein n=1 Tax=Penicillium vulpinum TaxID=29845 RepID=A0A1V6RZ98_9EURO|nr:uncharacterized protein N7479_009508 [Penicillium vulpinum]KAJ5951095.1 hypothetical protein N7479_009508 [Penicillium vulpinum]OQE06804.1 hypothetical protein PENVUL_c016G07012 [Penicillium vulpinum]